jgi:hypothetical protein
MSKAKTRRARPPASTLRSKPAQCSIRHPEALPGSQPQSEPAGPSPMELAYAEWQQARAALQQVDIHAPVSSPALDEDERLTSAMKRVDASEWKIVQTCAHDGFDVRLRAMALQQVFLDAEMSGEPTDNRHLMMLSALIHDVLDSRFDWRRE